MATFFLKENFKSLKLTKVYNKKTFSFTIILGYDVQKIYSICSQCFDL